MKFHFPFQGSLDVDVHLLLGEAVRIKEVRCVVRHMERAEGSRPSRPLGDGPSWLPSGCSKVDRIWATG